MKLKTLENQLQRYADAKELSLEDAIVILNAVYDAFSYDLGKPLSACRVEDPETLVEYLTSQLYGLLDVCAAHRSEIRAADPGDIAAAQKELSELHAQTAAIAAQRKKLAAIRAETAQERDALSAQRAALSDEERETEQLLQELSGLQHWMSEHPEDALANLRQQVQQLRDDSRARAQELSALTAEINTLQSELDTFPEQIRQAEEERDARAETQRQHAEALAALQAEREALTQRIAEIERESGELNTALLTERPKLDAQQALRDELQAQLDAQREALDAENANCDTLRAAFSETEQAYKDVYTRSSSLELSIRNLNTNIESLQQPIADAEAEKARLGADLADQTRALEALQDDNRRLAEALEEKAELTEREYAQLTESAAAEAERLNALKATLDDRLRAVLSEISDLLLIGIPDANRTLETNERALRSHKEEKAAIDRQISDGESRINKLLAEISEKKQFIGQEGSIEEKRARAISQRDALLPQWERVKICLQEAEAQEAENVKRRAEIDAANDRRKRAQEASAALEQVMTPEWRGQAALIKRRLQTLSKIYQCLGADYDALHGAPLPQYETWQDYLKTTGSNLDTLLSEIKKYADLK